LKNLKNVLKNSNKENIKMKTSNKILLIAGVAPILSVILLMAAIKIIPGGDASSQASPSGEPGMVSRTLPLEGFSEISTNGAWKVNLIQGDSFLVHISASESVMNEIKVEKNGNKLVLDAGTKFNRSSNAKHTTADITLPAVSRIDTEGMANINLSGLNIDSLTIHSEGVAKISGDKGMIRDLEFNGNGALMMDLSTIAITNADLKFQGAYMIGLLMNGGRLSGSLEGMGFCNYEGNISVNEILVNGSPNKVVHKTTQKTSP
jgi:hypothetical protein